MWNQTGIVRDVEVVVAFKAVLEIDEVGML